MKRLTRELVYILLFLHVILLAQKKGEGIYLSSSDFESQKLTYQKSEGKKYKLRIYENTHKKSIRIQIGDSVFNLSKDSVFGYGDKYYRQYRFQKGVPYYILYVGYNLLLYSRETLGGYKGTQIITEYYFSAGAAQVLYKLSKHNLKAVYKKQSDFAYRLDLQFNNEEDLTAIDPETKKYRLTFLIE